MTRTRIIYNPSETGKRNHCSIFLPLKSLQAIINDRKSLLCQQISYRLFGDVVKKYHLCGVDVCFGTEKRTIIDKSMCIINMYDMSFFDRFDNDWSDDPRDAHEIAAELHDARVNDRSEIGAW